MVLEGIFKVTSRGLLITPNVSQELTGDAARFAGHGTSTGKRKSNPGSEPRRLSSRLLARR